MKNGILFLRRIAIVAILFLTSFIADAQTVGSLSVTRDVNGIYHVYFKAPSDISFQILQDATITIVGPSGTWSPSNVITVNSPGNNWGLGNSKYTNGGSDYISFVPGNGPSSATNYLANTATELFNFSLSGACAGGSLNIYTGSEMLNAGVSYVTSLVVQDTPTSSAREGWDGSSYDLNTAACEVIPSLSCSGITLNPNTFTAGTTASASITVSLTGISAGAYNFSETTAANFATNPTTYSTNLIAGQTSVNIPINYDGGGSGSQTLTISMSGNNASTITCPVSAIINAAAVISVSNPTIPKTGNTNGGTQTGTASTEMNPTGATSYIYSTTVCSPTPAGTTPLPASSNLTITNASTGAYSYITPTTTGTYSYCIKVCDANNANNCATSTYTLNVSAVCNAGSVAPSVH
ncbi:hypothetical protein [Emticicia sp. SJ17W-69]|uniref:hypothetical protein n=1 Tax=Emticicia sp. SJ17W-69 TaxID=3421657 RepID=UPI003EB7BD0F